jgi:glycosyltransferase involved in cell wall biosynthesis
VPARLAVVVTHPIQYFSPWFRHIAGCEQIALKVFYLWDFGVEGQVDPGFQVRVQWDVPLLSGYDHEFVPNKSLRPGTDRFMGLWNPSLAGRVRDFRPDAVLLLGYNFASLLHFIFNWDCRDVPLIFRGDSHRIVKRRGLTEGIRRSLISRVFGRFAAFLYVGSANLDYFRCHGVPDAKLFRAPHAVDNERFCGETKAAAIAARQWREALRIPEGNSVVLFAGKFEAKKRPLDLLDAFKRAQIDNASLLFVGSGPLEAELRAAAATCANIHFAPFQNQTLMPRTYMAGDLFVLPSYGSSETWGLAVNEAMCMGRPVVVSDHVGCARDLVVPYDNGLIFPAGDVPSLVACLREALSDRERLKTWGENGRRKVSEFSYTEATAGLLRALEALGAISAAA